LDPGKIALTLFFFLFLSSNMSHTSNTNHTARTARTAYTAPTVLSILEEVFQARVDGSDLVYSDLSDREWREIASGFSISNDKFMWDCSTSSILSRDSDLTKGYDPKSTSALLMMGLLRCRARIERALRVEKERKEVNFLVQLLMHATTSNAHYETGVQKLDNQLFAINSSAFIKLASRLTQVESRSKRFAK
jgi:hypothetical protein